MKSLEKSQETVLNSHSDEVATLAVTSDNKHIISGSYDKTIRVWNLLEKKQKILLKGHS